MVAGEDKVRADAGSVLVETMVAAAIMAVVLGAACQGLGDGARRVASAERARLAWLEARSRLDEVGADIPLAPGASSGQDGELDWRVRIDPAPGGALTNGRLLSVAVDVSQDGRPLASLSSLRLAPASGAAAAGPA